MSYCKKYQTQINDNDSFCSTCGTQQNVSREDGNRFVQASKTHEGIAQIRLIKARHRKINTVGYSIIGISVIVSVGLYMMTKDFVAFYLGIPFVIISGIYLQVVELWSESEYYSVPGSRDETGKHRCIWCGHLGIYRHGAYRSAAKYADCSKCGSSLWFSFFG